MLGSMFSRVSYGRNLRVRCQMHANGEGAEDALKLKTLSIADHLKVKIRYKLVKLFVQR